MSSSSIAHAEALPACAPFFCVPLRATPPAGAGCPRFPFCFLLLCLVILVCFLFLLQQHSNGRTESQSTFQIHFDEQKKPKNRCLSTANPSLVLENEWRASKCAACGSRRRYYSISARVWRSFSDEKNS